jgi:hypothetical protein
MANQRFRGALNSASFPLLSRLQGRTIVQPQLDLNIPRRYQSSQAADAGAIDTSIPQVMYCENVVPTGEGYQSCRYEQVLPGIPGVNAFDAVINLRDTDEHTFPYAPAGGLNYVYLAKLGTWISCSPDTTLAGRTISRAFVNGRTFICFANRGVYEFDSVTNTFTHLTLLGVDNTLIEGIGASSNYLIAYDLHTVFWSSLLDPLDLVPSLLTGAGFAIPQDVRGNITAILGINGGFIIYTTVNAVAAVYSNNVRAPWNFKEIANAGGVTSFEQVSSEQTAGSQYAWTTNGLQKLTLQGVDPVSGEVNDFLSGRVWEEYDKLSNTLVEHAEDAVEFLVKVAYISGRYLIISYCTDGTGVYQYALLYDTTLKRWGRLKIDHVDCFAFRSPALIGDLTYDDLAFTAYDDLGDTTYDGLTTGIVTTPASKRTLGFLSTDGTVKVLVADYNKVIPEDGVIVFGKFQLVRARLLTHQTTQFEGTYATDADGKSLVKVIVANSMDGLNQDEYIEGTILQQTKKSLWIGARITGINITETVIGTFALSSYVVEASIDGSR